MSLNRLACYTVLLAGLAMLAGCGKGPAQAPAAEAVSRSLQPADTAIAGIYRRSCASCHTVAATGAPLTGDRQAWAPRMARGMDTLVNSVVNGFGGMPPFGLCMDCDVAQFEALIRFMATGE